MLLWTPKKERIFLERKQWYPLDRYEAWNRLETVVRPFCIRLEFLLEWKLKEIRKKVLEMCKKTMANCACVYIFFKDVTKVCAWNYSFVRNCSFPELLVHGTEFLLGTFGKPFFICIKVFIFFYSVVLLS